MQLWWQIRLTPTKRVRRRCRCCQAQVLSLTTYKPRTPAEGRGRVPIFASLQHHATPSIRLQQPTTALPEPHAHERCTRTRCGRGRRFAMSRIGFCFALVAVLAAACSQGSEDRSLDLTLEVGPECVYQGPDTLASGPATISFENPMKVPTWVHLVRLAEGRTVEEFEERFVTIPGGGLPEWSTLIWRYQIVDRETTITDQPYLDEGLYAMVCGTVSPDQGYFAAGVTVRD